MKPIEITKQDVLGYEHTFVVRHDAHRILRQIDGAGSVVFEVTVAYLLSQSI